MDRYKALIAVAMDSGAICFKSFYFFYFKYIKIIFFIFNINTSKSPKHTKDINLKTFNKFKNKKVHSNHTTKKCLQQKRK